MHREKRSWEVYLVNLSKMTKATYKPYEYARQIPEKTSKKATSDILNEVAEIRKAFGHRGVL